ncbi:Zinc finger, CCHC-type [Corchorus capsularis]|uniref:Zinc finger, CCHC-type n=1 Tax=Corchorus capsularis TaxID=210143 RepID=A0A1R3GLB4_COCAP|nr:Zinc finger, CCHC-type [Corchorus capsularis]
MRMTERKGRLGSSHDVKKIGIQRVKVFQTQNIGKFPGNITVVPGTGSAWGILLSSPAELVMFAAVDELFEPLSPPCQTPPGGLNEDCGFELHLDFRLRLEHSWFSEPSQPITIKLDGTNYNHWSYLMRNFLKGKGLWKYVTGDKKCPRPQDGLENFVSEYEEWEINNSKILTWIANCVIPSISMLLGRFNTAKEVWDFLEKRYVQTDLARRYKLEMDLAALKQKRGQSISDFHSEMQVIWDQLAAMEPKWTVDAELYYQFREASRLVQFLMALQDEFESVRASILHRVPRPSVDAVISELMAEETRRGVLNQHKVGDDAVLVAAARPKSLGVNSFGTSQSRRDFSKIECYYCHELGHTKYNCPKLKKKTDSSKMGRVAAVTSSAETLDADTHSTADQTQEIIRQVISSMSNNSMGNNSIAASALSTSPGISSKDWIIDSGAFNHMTFDSSILESSKPISYSSSIHTANGSRLLDREGCWDRP